MATIQVTNQRSSQSLNGTAVTVTLDETDAAQLENFLKGQLVTNDGNSKTGTINRVDYPGNSFTVNPIQPDKDFGTYGYLLASQTVTVTT